MCLETTWIPHGNFQPLRYRPGNVGNWSGHLPFAKDLVAATKPKLFVELGTHYGESYFGFCQAVAENDTSCSCYAVDNWLGEDQAGHYDESVYQEVYTYNDARYKSFSYLLRTTFDKAIDNFSDNTIDILHIDGLHTYEAVAHDFYNWLPKVRPNGIVLLHDAVARHADFGVWKLWEELSRLGERFLFSHSWGLGVFRKTCDNAAPSDHLSGLFQAKPQKQDFIKKFYSLCALKLEDDHVRTLRAVSEGAQIMSAQFFPRTAAQYLPETHYDAGFESGRWQKVHIELSAGFGEGALRVDLAQQPCILDIAGITLYNAVEEKPLWMARGPEIAALPVSGDMSLFDTSHEKEFCRFLSTGNDPQLYIAPPPSGNLDQPLSLEIWVRAIVQVSSLVQTLKALSHDREGQKSDPKWGSNVEDADHIGSGNETLETHPSVSALSECNATLQDLQTIHSRLIEQHEILAEEKRFLSESYRKLQGDLYVAKSDLLSAKADLETMQTTLNNAKSELGAARANSELGFQRKIQEGRAQIDDLVHARNIEAAKSRQLEKTLQEVLASRSWRVTAPLRNFRSR